MIDQKTMQKAAEYIRKNCQAHDWSFSIRSANHTRTRFAQNGITQHITGDSNGISLTVAFDAKTGSASVNDTSEAGLAYLIETAETIALRNQPDPEFVVSESAKELPVTDNFSEATEKLSPADLVNVVEKCLKMP